MQALSPRLASELADLVYEIQSPSSIPNLGLKKSQELKSAFDIDLSNGPVTGTTGGFFGLFSKTSGFALVGHGKNQFQGQHVVAIRGTQDGHDWLTNGNVGYSTCASGSTVHAGFNEAFESMKGAFESLLSPHLTGTDSRGVHCVGHSLGGALASLTADWIKDRYRKPVNIYTFGAPRVGLEGFAQHTTHAAARLYRCTHGADPVPNVPLWPFIHAPANGFEYRLDNGSGIAIDAHGMGKNKVPGYRNTANTSDWSRLHQASLDFLKQPVRLDYERRHEASFSAYWSERISAALITLLKDAGYYTAVLAQAAVSSTLTFYDLLARTIEQVAQSSRELADQARGLLGHMLAFARVAVTAVVELTFSFIRWVFDKTVGALYRAVREALQRA
ncbi:MULTISPECIES: lipase family protein [Marinobacter]|uniref:lipase family protein n=1 Tax=Marinobacter TaxID=2742 RepID=UPI001D09913D|nr:MULTISPECIES: lipase family protein [Marinobacter]MCG8517335.1 lipase family protein [Pseudomonadales bacterium]MCK7567156.1 lipase family protein [Marinobacter xestospongiae]UDL04767.1 lipase family protein [Marinobacter sp. CA1]